jgi:hypothetical protein
MNLRPNLVNDEIKEESYAIEVKEEVKENYIKTSVSLSRALAVRARRYVNAQQLAHAQGQRQTNYSFSQLYNNALTFYLEHLEKGESYEKAS